MDFFNICIILFRFAHLPSTISHIKHLALRKQEKHFKNENRMGLPHPTILGHLNIYTHNIMYYID